MWLPRDRGLGEPQRRHARHIFGQALALVEPAAGAPVELAAGVVVAVAVVVVAGVVAVEDPVAALAITAPPPASAPATINVANALWTGEYMVSPLSM
jgi:hypothetical protein